MHDVIQIDSRLRILIVEKGEIGGDAERIPGLITRLRAHLLIVPQARAKVLAAARSALPLRGNETFFSGRYDNPPIPTFCRIRT